MDESRVLAVEGREYANPSFQAPDARSWCGWACLLGLIALASNMVDPSYLDPAHQNFIFIIGVIGIWRYSNAVTHYLRGMYFLHWRFPQVRRAVERMGDAALPSHMYMVVTSFRIPTETTYKVYRSVFEELQRLSIGSTVIASIVEKADENFIKQIMREVLTDQDDIHLVIIRARGTGKRDGLAHAFRALSRRMPVEDAVVGVVDGDTIMLPGCIERAAKLFAYLPNVGGVTTNEFCSVEGGRLIKEWHTMRFVQRHINMCSMSLSHRVLTLTGRLSFFRATVMTDPEFIRDVEADFLEHWRLGRFQFLTGDDKSSWFSLMRAGWDTYYVPDSHTLTVEHPPDSNFFRATKQLMYRWYGNSLRQNFRATRELGLRRLGGFASYVLYDQRVSMWTCLVGMTGSIVAGLAFGIEYLLIYLFWILLSRTLVTLLFFFTRHPVDPLYPFVLYYNQIVGSVMKVYSMFHMDRQSWTRQKTTLNSGVNFDAVLNQWTSKAMLMSSIAIFFGVISILLDVSQL